ncbi:MAG: EF-P lysine aminoacylase EpmA [Planctomycetota bacterium]
MSPAKRWSDSLRQRARLIADIRQFFDNRGFLEVTPPCLHDECILDRHIDPMPVGDGLFLQTSPELAMKRMLVAGSGSIYSLGPVFRAGECGDQHRPEFWLLEWYEVGADYSRGLDTLATFSLAILPGDACERLSYRRAFVDAIGLDPLDASLQQLAALIPDQAFAESLADHRDDLLDVLLTQFVQPRFQTPTILYDYPLSQAALAKMSPNDAACAARYEWFAGGVELGNGYDELLDADELRRRMRDIQADRRSRHRPDVRPPDSLVHAMVQGMPASCGVAVGIDRLQMLRGNGKRLMDLMPPMSTRR